MRSSDLLFSFSRLRDVFVIFNPFILFLSYRLIKIQNGLIFRSFSISSSTIKILRNFLKFFSRLIHDPLRFCPRNIYKYSNIKRYELQLFIEIFFLYNFSRLQDVTISWDKKKKERHALIHNQPIGSCPKTGRLR